MPNKNNRFDTMMKESVGGFARYIGLEPVKMTDGAFVTRLKLTGDLLQPDGFAHAGLIATIADHTAGFAGYSVLPDGHHLLTVQFSVNYLRPATGPVIECHANVVKQGKQIVYTEAEVYSVRGHTRTLVAKASHTGTSVPPTKA